MDDEAIIELLEESKSLIKNHNELEALKIIDQALEMNPEFAYSWFSRGVALYQIDRHEEAVKALDRAIEFNPEEHSVWYVKGKVLFEMNKIDEALIAFETASTDTTDPEVWFWKGICELQMNKIKDAVTSLNKSSELGKNDFEIYMALGQLHLDLSMYDDAIELFNEALKFQNNGYTQLMLGFIHMEQKNYDPALDALNQAIAMDVEVERAKEMIDEIKQVQEDNN
jgi:tetratricopeptide (TPR) repeat protein